MNITPSLHHSITPSLHRSVTIEEDDNPIFVEEMPKEVEDAHSRLRMLCQAVS